MSFDDISAVNLTSTDGAIVWSLRPREATLGPAIGPSIRAEEGVFLLETKPGLVLSVCLHQSRGLVTVVILVGASIRIPSLAQDKNVIATTEWVRKDCDRADIDIRIITWGLTSR